MNEYGVVLFHTNSAALGAEKHLREAGLEIKLIPTPRQFSSDCGIALRFLWQQKTQVLAVLQEKRIEFDPQIHILE